MRHSSQQELHRKISPMLKQAAAIQGIKWRITMTRLTNIIGVTLGAGFAAFAVAAHAEDLVVSNWDGYMAPDAIEKYNAATGNSAELVLHATNEEIRSEERRVGKECLL